MSKSFNPAKVPQLCPAVTTLRRNTVTRAERIDRTKEAPKTEGFSLVQLEPDEHIVFGISLENETRKGVTNKRVVIEVSMGYTNSIANSEVRRVTLARETRMTVDVLRIVSIQDGGGRTHPLGLGGIDARLEPALQELFPGARLATRKKRGTTSVSRQHRSA